jgi:hypothetical protein
MPKELLEPQTTLFEPERPYNLTVVKEVDGYNIPVHYGQEGSYINIHERAILLAAALTAMSQRNMRDGFSIAPYKEPYSAPIWERYQENTQQVVDGASRNRNIYQNQLRRNFWEATGFAALRGTGLMRERQINPAAQKMWRDFNKKYGHPEDLSARNKYKKKLQEQMDFLKQSCLTQEYN